MKHRALLRKLAEDIYRMNKEKVASVKFPERYKFCGARRIVRYGHYQSVQQGGT